MEAWFAIDADMISLKSWDQASEPSVTSLCNHLKFHYTSVGLCICHCFDDSHTVAGFKTSHVLFFSNIIHF